MKISSNLLVFFTVAVVLIFKLASTGKFISLVDLCRPFISSVLDAAALLDEKSALMESSASDENEASIRDKKNVEILTGQHVVPAPLRRHHLKFGVLGKRHSSARSSKRNERTYARARAREKEDEISFISSPGNERWFRRMAEFYARTTCRSTTVWIIRLKQFCVWSKLYKIFEE